MFFHRRELNVVFMSVKLSIHCSGKYADIGSNSCVLRLGPRDVKSGLARPFSNDIQ